MSGINDGGPAYPHMGRDRPDLGPGISEEWTKGGMSLRDAFAIAALQGLVSSYAGISGSYDFDNDGLRAYRFADAALAARKVQP